MFLNIQGESVSFVGHRSDALHQGTTLQLAQKLWFLKGTGFSPYVRIKNRFGFSH